MNKWISVEYVMGIDPDSTIETNIWDRLIWEPSVSTDYPCVKGTWLTVNHVIQLIVDGMTWTNVLRTHPELCEDDIRACLVWIIEDEQRTNK